MYKYIVKQWKQNKVTMFLIVLGFFVASIVLSIGVSMTVRQIEYSSDMLIGGAKEQLRLNLSVGKKAKPEETQKLLERCMTFGEIQVLNCDNVRVDKNKYQVVPVGISKEYSWHIPIIEGRYLKSNDMKQKVAVIGKTIAHELNLAYGDRISINGEEYQVIGIAGRDYRETIWDEVIYIPWQSFVMKNMEYITKQKQITMILKEENNQYIQKKEELEQVAKQNDSILYEKRLEDIMDEDIQIEGLQNTYIITVLSAVLVFLIAIINITNLMLYRIMARQEEFGIMKALGATNFYIMKLVFFEIVSVTIISSLAALCVQKILSVLFYSALNEVGVSLTLGKMNIIVILLVAGLTGIISSVVPAYRAIQATPVQILNGGD